MGPFDSALFVSVVGLSAPVLWAALGELISERGGVINIGLEGMVLGGAFAAYYVTWLTGSVWVGALASIAAGVAFAAIMGVLAIDRQADQIIVGLGILILGGGASALAFEQIFTGTGRTIVDHMSELEIPLLSDVPVIGEALFKQVPLVYLAYLAVPLVWWLLWRTRWGLAVRAAGESPEALEADGISVRAVRWTALLCAGVGGGLAGATLVVGSLGTFTENMSAGRGFIALAAVVFGRWRPVGVLGACLVFGGADALQLRLQAVGSIPWQVWTLVALIGVAAVAVPLVRGRQMTPAMALVPGVVAVAGFVLAVTEPTIDPPSQIWLMFPYVLALLVLAGFVGRARMPSALGLPYRRASEVA